MKSLKICLKPDLWNCMMISTIQLCTSILISNIIWEFKKTGKSCTSPLQMWVSWIVGFLVFFSLKKQTTKTHCLLLIQFSCQVSEVLTSLYWCSENDDDKLLYISFSLKFPHAQHLKQVLEANLSSWPDLFSVCPQTVVC